MASRTAGSVSPVNSIGGGSKCRNFTIVVNSATAFSCSVIPGLKIDFSSASMLETSSTLSETTLMLLTTAGSSAPNSAAAEIKKMNKDDRMNLCSWMGNHRTYTAELDISGIVQPRSYSRL